MKFYLDFIFQFTLSKELFIILCQDLTIFKIVAQV